MIYALLGTGIGSALAVGIVVWRLCSTIYDGRARLAQAERDQARGEAKRLDDLARATAGQHEMERLQAEDDRRRLCGVINRLRDEIAQLEEDLDACHDPAAVRERLRRVLAVPDAEASRPGGSPAVAGLSPGAATGGARGQGPRT